MILFFPQYQAGAVPSRIPSGTPALRALWAGHKGFCEVPLQQTNPDQPEREGNIRFRRVLKAQLLDAMAIVKRENPDFILTTGGDCGASFVPIAYMNKKYEGKIGVIWVDAHADIHAPSTSPSGNYHGMVLRHLMGEVEFEIQPERPLTAGQIAYLGLRDTEAEEDSFIAKHKIPRYSAKDIMEDDAPLHSVLDHFRRQGITHLHLHVDCDVMDEKTFPFVHVPEPAGLGFDRLIEILKILRREMPLSSCCLTEYAPFKEGDGMEMVKRIYKDGLGV